MTREQAKELLPVIQAYAEGKTIQVSRIGSFNWQDVNNDRAVYFESDQVQWRIKPEPREFWLRSPKQPSNIPWSVWMSKPPKESDYEIIHVREVLE